MIPTAPCAATGSTSAWTHEHDRPTPGDHLAPFDLETT